MDRAAVGHPEKIAGVRFAPHEPEQPVRRFAESNMRRVIYISRSHMGTDPVALDAIVEVSSMRNAAAGISGMLWSGPSEFVQALEGDHDKVSETMKRIEADPRHSEIEIICDGTVQSRMFGAWAMVRSNAGAECTASTAYLIGYAGRQRSTAARRVVELLLSHDD